MRFSLFGCRVHISFYFAAVVTLMLANDSDNLALFSFLGVLAHESSHLIMYFLFHDIPAELELGIFGIRITQKNAAALSYRREMAVIAAGPLMNFAVAAVLFVGSAFFGAEQLTKAAAVNFLLGVLNLVPIDPLDGGRLLFCAFALKMQADKAAKLTLICSVAFLLPLGAAAFYFVLFRGFNPTLLILCVYLCVFIVLHNNPLYFFNK